jgi:hypothetical protein
VRNFLFFGAMISTIAVRDALQAGAPVVHWLQFSRGEISIITDPTTAIRREVVQLIDQ